MRRLTPRRYLFDDPDKASPRISPDGRFLAYLAPNCEVLNIWSQSLQGGGDVVITNEKLQPIRSFNWAFSNQHIVYPNDRDGNEQWHVYVTDIESGQSRDLTPYGEISAQITLLSHKFPYELLVAINDNDRRFHDVYQIDIRSGKRSLVLRNEGYAGFVFDDDFKLRFVSQFEGDGSLIFKNPQLEGGWLKALELSPEDALSTKFVGFNTSSRYALLIDSRGRNNSVLTKWDVLSGEQCTIASVESHDITQVLLHPTEKTLQAIGYYDERQHWMAFDGRTDEAFSHLQSELKGDIEIVSRSLRDNMWVVRCVTDRRPAEYFLFDRDAPKIEFVFSNNRQLEKIELNSMRPVRIVARDGLELLSYLTLPPDIATTGSTWRPATPVPLVLLIHGGPWSRDTWGFDALHQLFSDRGYAALSVNFRGSAGFGKAFLNAGDKEWGGRMQDDLVDAIKWAVAQGIADKNKIAVFGGSYGGYAALMALATAEVDFACGISIDGPSDLVSFLENSPPYWEAALPLFYKRVGDPTTDDGRRLLVRRSPTSHLDLIRSPLLIIHGKNDPRVRESDSSRFVAALRDRNVPVTYITYSQEGHGFSRPESRISLLGVVEMFLENQLGGRAEPVDKIDLEKASVSVEAGMENIPDLGRLLTH